MRPRQRHPPRGAASTDDDGADAAPPLGGGGGADDHRRAFWLSADGPLWAWLEGLPDRQVPAAGGAARRRTGAPFTCADPGDVLLRLPGPVEDGAVVARCRALERTCGGDTRFCPATGVLRAGRRFRAVPPEVWRLYVQ